MDGNNSLTVSEASITALGMDGTVTLEVLGGSSDSVSSTDTWTNSGSITVNGIELTRFESGSINLDVQLGIDISGIIT